MGFSNAKLLENLLRLSNKNSPFISNTIFLFQKIIQIRDIKRGSLREILEKCTRGPVQNVIKILRHHLHPKGKKELSVRSVTGNLYINFDVYNKKVKKLVYACQKKELHPDIQKVYKQVAISPGAKKFQRETIYYSRWTWSIIVALRIV